jgi:hypothetical protein
MAEMQEKNTNQPVAFYTQYQRQLPDTAKRLVHYKYVLQNGVTVDLNPDNNLDAVPFFAQDNVRTIRNCPGKFGLAELTKKLPIQLFRDSPHI